MEAEAGGVDEEAIGRRGGVVAAEGRRRSPDLGPGDLNDRVVEDEKNLVLVVGDLGFLCMGCELCFEGN